MNENEFLAKTICEQLEGGSPVVLVSLLKLTGSTPRHAGSKMAVAADGTPYGTIGGSLLEAASIEKARELFTTQGPTVLRYELTGENAAADGMICGGTAEVLLDYLPPAKENQALAGYWYDAVHGGVDCFILTCLRRDGDTVSVDGHLVMFPDGQVLGEPLLEVADQDRIKSELRTITKATVISLEERDVLVDPIRRLKTLYVFGAGHVAVPTAHLAALTGFHVNVIDDRTDFANAERFPEARGIHVIDDFNRALEGLPIDKDSYLVIVTRGHQYDRVVLEQALQTPAEYIGMISSRKKRETIYAALRETGVTQEMLDRVHSPIGIAIGGETPEEIAVSIVAELIAVRSGQKP